MNRRAFLSTLAIGIVALADQERLLWTPSAKRIFVPPLQGVYFAGNAFAVAAIDLPLPPPMLVDPVTGLNIRFIQHYDEGRFIGLLDAVPILEWGQYSLFPSRT